MLVSGEVAEFGEVSSGEGEPVEEFQLEFRWVSTPLRMSAQPKVA